MTKVGNYKKPGWGQLIKEFTGSAKNTGKNTGSFLSNVKKRNSALKDAKKQAGW